jgi:hypothetical protein
MTNQKREDTKSITIFGSILAIVISWSLNKSLFWAIVHGVLNWAYIVYCLITGQIAW